MRNAALTACVLLSSVGAAAAELTVSATLSNHIIRLGDQLVLSVAISGSGSATPAPPLIADVEIYESGKSQSMSIVNGRVSSRVVHTYVLNPQKTGRYTVPPFVVPGAAPTAPLIFNVEAVPRDDAPAPTAPAAPSLAPPAGPAPSPPQAAPAQRVASPDAFVTATIDKKQALVNEQVTLTVRFYTAVPLLGPPQYDAPKLTGLLSENLGTEGQGATAINGRTYNYSELRTALFPVQAGRAAIGPAIVTVQLPRRSINTGDDFFDRFFSMPAPETRRLQTDPLTFQSAALPPGAPDDFSGIVGTLNVESSVDRTQLRVGEALNLKVVISGVGNIKSIAEPRRPELPSLRFFDSESSVTINLSGNAVGGSKTFKMVAVPRVSGPLHIPAFSVSYYDPAKQAYALAKSKPILLTVLPGDPNATLPVVGPGTTSTPGVTEVAADIRYLKAPNGSSALGDALGAFGAPALWHALPAAFFFIALIFDLRRRSHAANPRARRAREAQATAKHLLGKAEEQPDTERAHAVALLGDALTGYFSDTFDQPASSLTLKAVSHRLQNQKQPLEAAVLMRLKSVWEELGLLRYAPGGAGQAEVKRLADEIRDLILVFDKELRS